MKLNFELRELLSLAKVECKNASHPNLEPMHLAMAMLLQTNGFGIEMIQHIDSDSDKLFESINEMMVNNFNVSLIHKQNKEVILSKETQDIMISATKHSVLMLDSEVGVQHLMIAMTEVESDVKITFQKFGITKEKLVSLLKEFTPEEIKQNNKLKNNPLMSMDEYEDGTINVPIKSNNKSKTPVLDSFSKDLTELAKEGKIQEIVGRSNEIDNVIITLLRKNKRNPLIIGEAGVGKTALAEALALKIVENDVPTALVGKRVLDLDVTGMLAGTKFRGQFEERIAAIKKEIEKQNNIILFIDELHTIIGAGSAEGTLDLANMLKPMLSKGQIQIMASTTLKEYTDKIQKDSALARRFQNIYLNEPNADETILILEGIKKHYETHHNVTYSSEVIETAVRLADRFIFNKHFPDKAFDIIDEAGSLVRKNESKNKTDNENPKLVELSSRVKLLSDLIKEKNNELLVAVQNHDFHRAADIRDEKVNLETEKAKADQEHKLTVSNILEEPIESLEVTKDDIYSIVTKITKIPVKEIFEGSEESKNKLLKLGDYLNGCVIGQENAIKEIHNHILRLSVGIRDESKPSVLLFIGSTGVGKTLVAKELAKEYFGTKESFIRLNMNDYQDSFTVSNIIGSPKGYTGSDTKPKFLEDIKNNPYSIVLLDEIEKAHPSIFNTFLQIFDEGEFTDVEGVKYSFKNTIFILTSNIGVAKAQDIGNGMGFVIQENNEQNIIMNEVKKFFRPELLNRISKIVQFNPIKKDQCVKIVELEMDKLAKRLSNKNIQIVVKPQAKELIAENGFSEKFGARNIIRAIEEMVEIDLAMFILNNPSKEKITITTKNDKIVIK